MAELIEKIIDVIVGVQNLTLFAPIYGVMSVFTTLMLQACGKLIDLMSGGFNELISNSAVQAYFTFLQVFASILFVAGIAMAISEWAINARDGNAESVMSTFKYILLGLFANLGFTTIPVLLMQFTAWCTDTMITNMGVSVTDTTINQFSNIVQGNTDVGGVVLWYVFEIIFIISIVKIFLSNMKRGGVLLVLLVVCPFHIFNIPRGHVDSFFSWCKQVLALYVTTFIQNFLLALSLRITASSSGLTTANMCICIGVLLAATEAPQWLQQFGLDSSVKASPTQAIYAASGLTNIISTISKSA